MEHLLNEWCIHFIDIRKNVELAHPRDVYWNMKAIYEVFEDIEISLKIAYGIKAIYEKTRECIKKPSLRDCKKKQFLSDVFKRWQKK